MLRSLALATPNVYIVENIKRKNGMPSIPEAKLMWMGPQQHPVSLLDPAWHRTPRQACDEVLFAKEVSTQAACDQYC